MAGGRKQLRHQLVVDELLFSFGQLEHAGHGDAIAQDAQKPDRGSGSRFVVIYESFLHLLLTDARAAGGGIQARGWHRKWSSHGLLFLDGHAENRFMDTRLPFGNSWTIWPDRPL